MVGRIRIGGMAWLAMAVALSLGAMAKNGSLSFAAAAARFGIEASKRGDIHGPSRTPRTGAPSSWPRADSCIFNYGKREERDGTERALADEIYIMRATRSVAVVVLFVVKTRVQGHDDRERGGECAGGQAGSRDRLINARKTCKKYVAFREKGG